MDPLFKEPVDPENFKNIDQLAFDHANTFWKVYDLPLKYSKLEHKKENISNIAAFGGSKAHYAFNQIDENGYYTKTLTK